MRIDVMGTTSIRPGSARVLKGGGSTAPTGVPADEPAPRGRSDAPPDRPLPYLPRRTRRPTLEKMLSKKGASDMCSRLATPKQAMSAGTPAAAEYTMPRTAP